MLVERSEADRRGEASAPSDGLEMAHDGLGEECILNTIGEYLILILTRESLPSHHDSYFVYSSSSFQTTIA